MLPLVVGALSAIGSVVYLYLDWNTSQDIADSISQMEYYVNLLNGQMSLTEFIEGAWPSMVVIGLILLAGYIIATPQRKKEDRT